MYVPGDILPREIIHKARMVFGYIFLMCEQDRLLSGQDRIRILWFPGDLVMMGCESTKLLNGDSERIRYLRSPANTFSFDFVLPSSLCM